MDRVTLIAALLLMASSQVVAGQESVTVQVTWRLSLDADGSITRISTDDKRIPKLHAPLERVIREWHFSAGRVNGVPAPTETSLSTSLNISVADDHFEVHLDRAETGGTYRSIQTPHYPLMPSLAKRGACVALLVEYDASGLVMSAEKYSTSADADERFVTAALNSVKSWTFDPEVVGGHPQRARALVPIVFAPRTGAQPHCLDHENRELGDGRALALEPAAKLESDVIEKIL